MTLDETGRADSVARLSQENSQPELPGYYATVADDIVAFCGDEGGRVWVDLGTGPGGLGRALLEKIPDSVMTYIDPKSDSLRRFAVEAGLQAFKVIGEGGQESDARNAGVNIWLRFTKENEE